MLFGVSELPFGKELRSVGAILVIALGEGRQQQGEYKIRPYDLPDLLYQSSVVRFRRHPYLGSRPEVNTSGVVARSGKRV